MSQTKDVDELSGEQKIEYCFVPFLDLANHNRNANCDFRLSEDAKSIELVALRDLRAGEEVTISYSGKENYSNQRQVRACIKGRLPASRA